MIFTGVGVGVIGAYLDILVQWYVEKYLQKYPIQWVRTSRLNDIRQGRCSLGLFYNQVTCCSGLDRKWALSTTSHSDCIRGSW